jgi:hypothetical protein
MAAESPPEQTPIGAYGLHLANVEEARSLLVGAEPGWPSLRVEHRVGRGAGGDDWMTESAARLNLQSGGEILIDRARAEATYVLPRQLGAAEIVHPLLAPAAAVTSYWFGRESFHAGAFATGDTAWGLIGDRGAGKSTLVAGLALEGVPIVCDDLLIVEGDRAHEAPRSVDLRQEAAEQLGVGEAIGLVGARERWRLRVPEVGRPTRIGGWVFLAWSDSVEVEPVRAAERFMRLHDNRGTTVPLRDAEDFLALASLPAWELRRPMSWDALPDAVDCLLDAVG